MTAFAYPASVAFIEHMQEYVSFANLFVLIGMIWFSSGPATLNSLLLDPKADVATKRRFKIYCFARTFIPMLFVIVLACSLPLPKNLRITEWQFLVTALIYALSVTFGLSILLQVVLSPFERGSIPKVMYSKLNVWAVSSSAPIHFFITWWFYFTTYVYQG